MALSEKKKASNKKWNDANVKKFSLTVRNDLHDKIIERIARTGETKNGFIIQAVIEKLERDSLEG